MLGGGRVRRDAVSSSPGGFHRVAVVASVFSPTHRVGLSQGLREVREPDAPLCAPSFEFMLILRAEPGCVPLQWRDSAT